MRIVAGDIGGTHARFALAEIEDGKVVRLDDPVVLKAGRYPGLPEAWRAFADRSDEPLPTRAAIAVAAPVRDGPLHFTNSTWVVDPATVTAELGIDQVLLLNDFGAMAHAIHMLPEDCLEYLCGPDEPLPSRGAISVVGPGTGLGIAILVRASGSISVIETEGAHMHYAPLDKEQQLVSDAIASRYGRTSVERVVSGPGLGEIVRSFTPDDERADADLWAAALSGEDRVAGKALDLFLASFGAAAGDFALAQGSTGVAVTGGLANRLRSIIPASRFHSAFCDKGRYEKLMERIPIRLVTHPQPGLFGAAAAFAWERG